MQKAIICFVMSARFSVRLSACLSVHLSVGSCATTRFPLDGFSWNLIFEYFSKICRENSSSLKSDKNIWDFTWRQINVFIVLLSFLLKLRVASDQSCGETANTFYVLISFLRESCFLWQCGKILLSRTGHIRQYGPCVLHVGYLRLQIQSQNIKYILFSPAKMVTRRRLTVPLCIHCLSCLFCIQTVIFKSL